LNGTEGTIVGRKLLESYVIDEVESSVIDEFGNDVAPSPIVSSDQIVVVTDEEVRRSLSGRYARWMKERPFRVVDVVTVLLSLALVVIGMLRCKMHFFPKIVPVKQSIPPPPQKKSNFPRKNSRDMKNGKGPKKL